MMDGKNSDLFQYFRGLLVVGFLELRKYVDEMVLIL